MATPSMKSFVAASLVAVSAAAFCATPSAWAASMSDVDTNHDGTISLQEAHAAAEKKFDKIDTDHNGKIEMKEASPMSKAITEMARHDKDQAIDKTEYMSGVDAAVQEADGDHSGTLNDAELKTPAGKKFLELVE